MGNILGLRPKINIALIGNTGNGKSSTGNMILGKEVFETKLSASAVTTKCQREENMVNNKKITVIDTPDFIDIDDHDEKIKSEIVRALAECPKGIHAFVIVLKVGKYSTQEKKLVQELRNTLNEDVLKHTVILFTHGEQLDGQTIETFVMTNSQLQELVNKCEGHCHMINKNGNEKIKKAEVTKLLKTIDNMVQKNGYYSNKLLQIVEKQIQEKSKKNAQLPKDKMSSEEKQEKAKNTVCQLQWLLEKVAKGVVVSAFLGVCQLFISELLVAFVENIWGQEACSYTKYITEGSKAAVKGGFSEFKAAFADSNN
ncbi:GTPase IMAP family member 7-like [Onychostoma macrolepis]|uniref:GTPase IMAP family member 7-like n=1 Tax=Onychostoma macrolepis TaxID=369639 RepID=UPI00272CDFD2|nr:GTPase IMAP family member 7-like [Onychostoma macrolepis]